MGTCCASFLVVLASLAQGAPPVHGASARDQYRAALACTYAVDPNYASIPAAALTGVVTVTADAGCEWTAISNDPSWLTITSTPSGTGNGSIDVSVAENLGEERTGTLTVAGITVTVNQRAPDCTYELATSSASMPAAGGAGSVGVTTNVSTCAWTAVSNAAEWLSVTAGASGTGNGTVSFTALANTGAQRSGTLTIAGYTFTVNQAAALCSYTVDPMEVVIPAAGGTTSVAVGTNIPTCTWTAVSHYPSWLAVTSGASGTGNGSVGLTISENTGSSRSGTVTIAGHTVRVDQAGLSCIVTLQPTAVTVPSGGGTARVEVSTNPPGCPWEAEAADPWITIGGDGIGIGAGTLFVSAPPSEGGERTGTVNVGATHLGVTQAAVACTYSLVPPAQDFPAAGGASTVALTTHFAGGTPANGAPDEPVASGALADLAGRAVTRLESFGARAQAVFAVSEHAMAETVSTTDCTVPGEVYTFAASTAAAYSWASFTGVQAGDVLLWEWYRPDGSFHLSDSHTMAWPGSICAWTSLPIAGAEAASHPGVWSVVVKRNGQPVVREFFTIALSTECPWVASSNRGWIAITSATSGEGDATIAFTVAANDTLSARSGALLIAGQTFAVNQDAGACTYVLSSTSATAPAAAGTGTVTVTPNIAQCTWTAYSNVGWMSINAGSSGTGPGTVTYGVQANTGDARSGTLTIAGETFTVNQEQAGCTFSLYSYSATFPPEGGDGSTRVWASRSACTWTAVSNAPEWLTVTGGASGSGIDFVYYHVAVNVGPHRQGTLTIAGRTYTVTQEANPCVVTLAPPNADVAVGGGVGTVGVTVPNQTCAWTAVSNDPGWLTITAGASGIGNGSVAYAAAGNFGEARTGALTIGGARFTVTQSAIVCTFGIDPTEASFNVDGGVGSIAVSASPETCAWTAASNAPEWLTVTSGAAGTGPGNVGYAVAGNDGDARIGTLTVAGLTFTASQAAAPCTFTIDPTTASFPASGGTGSITVTPVRASCAWTATSDAPEWLTISSGAAGTGPGEVAYTVADNPGDPRIGTLTVAGATFTVTQGRHGPAVSRRLPGRLQP